MGARDICIQGKGGSSVLIALMFSTKARVRLEQTPEDNIAEREAQASVLEDVDAAKLCAVKNIEKAEPKPLGEAIDRLLVVDVQVPIRVLTAYTRKWCHEQLKLTKIDNFYTGLSLVKAPAQDLVWSTEWPSFAAVGLKTRSDPADHEHWKTQFALAVWNDKLLGKFHSACKTDDAREHFLDVVLPIADILADPTIPECQKPLVLPVKKAILGSIALLSHRPGHKGATAEDVAYLVPTNCRDNLMKNELGRASTVLINWTKKMPEIERMHKDYIRCMGAEGSIIGEYDTMESVINGLLSIDSTLDMNIEDRIAFIKTNYPSLNNKRDNLRSRSLAGLDSGLVYWLQAQFNMVAVTPNATDKANIVSMIKELLAMLPSAEGRKLYRKVCEEAMAWHETDMKQKLTDDIVAFELDASISNSQALAKSLQGTRNVVIEQATLDDLIQGVKRSLPTAVGYFTNPKTSQVALSDGVLALWSELRQYPVLIAVQHGITKNVLDGLKNFQLLGHAYHKALGHCSDLESAHDPGTLNSLLDRLVTMRAQCLVSINAELGEGAIQAFATLVQKVQEQEPVLISVLNTHATIHIKTFMPLVEKELMVLSQIGQGAVDGRHWAENKDSHDDIVLHFKQTLAKIDATPVNRADDAVVHRITQLMEQKGSFSPFLGPNWTRGPVDDLLTNANQILIKSRVVRLESRILHCIVGKAEPPKKKEKVNRYLLDFGNETGNEIDWRAYLNNEVRDLVDITVA